MSPETPDDAHPAPELRPVPTRTVVAVWVLIAAAIAGVWIAARSSTSGELPDAAGLPSAASTASSVRSTLPAAPASPASVEAAAPAASVAADPQAALPASVAFAPGSDRLSGEASEVMAAWAEQARGDGRVLHLSAPHAGGATRSRAVELAQLRIAALKHAAESNGLPANRLRSELVEVPEGATGELDRVALSLR